MPDNLTLDFPILREDSGDFSEKIAYEVEAKQDDGKLHIEHRLKGCSFISNMIERGKAKFSVRLLYKDSSERQHHLYNASNPSMQNGVIAITQTITMDFSYAPEIMPSIIALKKEKITVNDSSGLTDFWRSGESFSIPGYARIAIGPKIKFSEGDVSHLMRLINDESLKDGEMKVEVNEYAGEGETPVTLVCGSDVYDQLAKLSQAEPVNPNKSMGWAIVTQALCATYAYMQSLEQGKKENVGGVLLHHLQMLADKTGKDWKDDDFEPSLAATKMHPYVLSVFKAGVDDE